MKVSARVIYSPLLLLYAMGPFIHDVIPHYSLFGIERTGYFTLFYMVTLLALLPILLYLKRVELKNINLTLGMGLRFTFGLGLYSVPYILFWPDWSFFYISLLISLYASFLSMVAFRILLVKQSDLFKDSVSGAYYRLKDGKAYPLAGDDVDKIRFCNALRFESAREFNSRALENHALQSSGSNSTTYGSTVMNDSFVINPASGMPMVGGISGLDIHGNSWGASFNEPSNTYDPNRGY
ncbi:hypothetical protein NUU98_19625 [Cronobacter sakazakii]|uniref:hypothetical protein n=1 Tax=Cronobacter sakazakii TaxID=28141 RepID=UPI0027B1173A|nr:hypothetical protein [Cronobacter sakazakii]MDQ2005189.1 hypothetical protein [Cronobacter sakazakii]